MMDDLRLAIRSVLRGRGFSAVVVLTLALGMGVNAAVFSVVDTLVFRPLPLGDADRLVSFVGIDTSSGAGRLYTSYADYLDYRRGAASFDAIEGYGTGTWVLSGDDRTPRQLDMATVTTGFFDALGVQPILGRTFEPAEHEREPDAVVISHSLWQSEFGGDPEAVGRTLTLSSRAMRVVGVMPAGFDYPHLRAMAGWVPLRHGEFEAAAEGEGAFTERDWNRLIVFGRLAEGRDVSAAEAELRGIATGIAEAFPRSNANLTMSLRSLKEVEVGSLRRPLLLVMAAVALILLIAVVNTASLLLARGTARAGEVAVRTALGAGRRRLVRLFLTEAFAYAVAGAALGLVLAQALLGVIRFYGADIPLLSGVVLDARVLATLGAVTVLSALLFGVAPALHGSRLDLQGVLKDGGRRGAGGGRARARLQRVFVTVELSLATVLVVGAGLLTTSFASLVRQDPGFDPAGVSSVRISLPVTYMSDPDDNWSGSNEFFEALVAESGRTPGFEAVALSYTNPLEPSTAFNTRYFVPGYLEPERADQPFTALQSVTPDFFDVFGIPITRGRGLSALDRKDAPGVVVINETMARQAFGEEDPIGHRLAGPDFWSPSGYPASWEIVGVVGDVRSRGLAEAPAPAMYLPFAQAPMGNMRLIVRSPLPPAEVAGSMRRAVWAMDPAIPMEEIHTMEAYISESVRSPRLAMWAMGGFAGLALVMAGIGIYGVLSYAVGLRAGEFGIRQVLGADRRTILHMVLRQGLSLAGLGLGIGLVLAWLAGGVLESQLFGISATHPPTLLAVSAVLILSAGLACLTPALRATRVEPVETLRGD
jgi:putative ABC transport system permease protein